MDYLKKMLLVIGFALLTLSGGAAQTSVCTDESLQLTQPAAPNNDIVETFEKLAQQALIAQKPLVVSRMLLGTVREFVKICGFLVFSHLAELAQFQGLTAMGMTFHGLSILAPVLSDRIIYKKDKSLTKLQQLEKYVTSLTTEQKNEIYALFQEKYNVPLSDKVSKDLDNQLIKNGRIFVTVFDVLFPIFLLFFADILNFSYEFGELAPGELAEFESIKVWWGKISKLNAEGLTRSIEMIKDYNDPSTMYFFRGSFFRFFAFLIVLATDIPQVLINAKHSSDYQRNSALAKIKDALTLSKPKVEA